jgi:hypothetical protein
VRNGFRRVRFVHLPPIDGMGAAPSRMSRLAKRAWFGAAAALFWVTRGGVNVDNLFADARR